MIFLLTLVGLLVLAGAGLLAEMIRRDEPVLGMAGMVAMLIAGLVGAVYGVLAST